MTAEQKLEPVAAELVCSPVSLEDAENATEEDPNCTGDGTAAASGVQVGDRFTRVDGQDIDEFPDVIAAVQSAGTDAADTGTEVGATA